MILLLAGFALQTRGNSISLTISPPFSQSPQWAGVQAGGEENQVLDLHASADLLDWKPIGRFHGAFDFLDPATPEMGRRYYRAALFEKTEGDDWKNQIRFFQDPLLSPDFGDESSRWIKFAIVLEEAGRVYYQDSSKYLFHYDFAAARLGPFQGMSRLDFDQVSLRIENQQVILGTVLFPPADGVLEYGIQFVGLDAYPKETIRDLFDLVRSTVVPRKGLEAFYMPVFEQAQAAEDQRAFFESNGIFLSGPDRWISGNSCYSVGWTLGPLKFIPANEINQAYAMGRLRPEDILVTDGIPAELPYVSGIISLAPATPNSHVAILARSYQIPFVYLPDPDEQQRIRALDEKEILLRATSLYNNGCEVKWAETDQDFDPAVREELLALKAVLPLEFTPKNKFGAFQASTANLVPADIQYFGGKAAHFGFLRRAIPDNSPVSIAFSFDLWDEFMEQIVTGGKTLREEIDARLGRYSYPPDIQKLREDLNAIRNLIRNTARFTPAQQTEIIAALELFDPLQKIRFRSSTNVEDSENFTGAGLYDSYSGCLADDLDGDETGPSHCDPEEKNERGVFRALQRVYASFYNENAFLERLRHHVDENQVGMAVLAHHSFPDDIEWANGVATLRHDPFMRRADLVTQAGAVSVSNPDGSARPEVVEANQYPFGVYLSVKQRSSLVPMGASVLDWEEDYRSFMDLFTAVAEACQSAFPGKETFLLDFEYKKIAPGHLVVKQVREIPLPDDEPKLIPFLLNESGTFVVFQGEFGDVFANHRLKSQWNLRAKNLRLTETNLEQSFYSDATFEHLEEEVIQILSGAPATWPNASFSFENATAHDRWTLGTGPLQRRLDLQSNGIKRLVSERETPLLFVSDLDLTLLAQYGMELPRVDHKGNPAATTEDAVRLVPRPQRSLEDLLQEREFEDRSGVNIRTSFYWPPAPKNIGAGYTAPLIEWVETRIEGLISEPILLTGYYSQTYRPEHHNFSEHFIFEPRLEPGLSEAAFNELIEKNIQLIHFYWDEELSKISLLGLDHQFRTP